jgi:hypothetical protein
MVEGANAMMWQDVTARLLLVKLDGAGRVVETATRAVQRKTT